MPCRMDSYSILWLAQYFESVTTDHDRLSDPRLYCFNQYVILISYLGAKRQLFSYS